MTASSRTPASWWPGRRGWKLAAAGAIITLAAAPALIGASAQAEVGAAAGRQAAGGPVVTPMTSVSSACAGQNAEVEEATAAPDYVYADWIGCNGIGFARSADGGLHWSLPITVPGSADNPATGAGSWDPAIAVAPSGTVYVSYMHRNGPGRQPGTSMYPVVATSIDHGQSFPQVSADLPPHPGDWGDRDFIAVGQTGAVYLTWDYGPSGPEVKLACTATGSCAYSNGDFNAVIQKSTNGGKTWGPITHIEPGFPLGGGYSAPLVVRPSGQVDTLTWGHHLDPVSYSVHPGHEFFTSSSHGVQTWSPLAAVGPQAGPIAVPTWWVDGDIAADAAGNLYATWDTQASQGDIGWLSYSRDGGRAWSPPVRVTPDTDNAPHIVEVAGGPPGVAYIAWQTNAPTQGYATYLRPFSIRRGWAGPAIQVSSQYGNPSIWPGDTFGIATLPGTPGRLSLTWGSAIGNSPGSEIYATDVTLPASRP